MGADLSDSGRLPAANGGRMGAGGSLFGGSAGEEIRLGRQMATAKGQWQPGRRFGQSLGTVYPARV
jgi:hypothetical protein